MFINFFLNLFVFCSNSFLFTLVQIAQYKHIKNIMYGIMRDRVCLHDPAIYDSRGVLFLLTTHKLNWLMGGTWTHMGQGKSDLTKTSCAYVKCIRSHEEIIVFFIIGAHK